MALSSVADGEPAESLINWPQITQITQIKEHFVVAPADVLSSDHALITILNLKNRSRHISR